MEWTGKDEQALEACRECLRTCRRYHVPAAPYFPLMIRMYEALEEAGMVERTGERPDTGDICAGCPEHVAGTCRKAYQFATLNPARDTVIRCDWREAPGMKERMSQG